MIFIYSLVALFIAWIWIDYFRLIDIYEKENLWYFLLTFLLGGVSTLLVFGLNIYLPFLLPLRMNGDFVNDFLYCVLQIGLPEEVAKLIPFLIVYRFCKNHINEPVDYIVYISISALGFSAVENVLYFHNYGPSVINGRAILSTVSHMFNSSLIAYGIIKYKYFDKKNKYFIILFYFLMSIFSHGFYDFWLMYEETKSFGWWITLLYFFLTISIFAVLLNNALNFSGFFSYKKVVNPEKVIVRLLIYYLIVLIVQLTMLFYINGTMQPIKALRGSMYLSGFIITVSVIRLSRFKLIQNRQEKIIVQLPFQIHPSGTKVQIKGNQFNETFVNAYYEEFFQLSPLTLHNSYLRKTKLTFIEKKIYLQNEEVYYVAKVYYEDVKGPFETMVLKPKMERITMSGPKNPIVAVLKITDIKALENPDASLDDFKFCEWAVIKPKK